jgi:hypothetical protein
VIYWAIDPGETTGWAKFEDGKPTEFQEFKMEEFYLFMWSQPSPELIVMEDYLIKPAGSGGYDHVWGRVPTIQVIGAVKSFATVRGLPTEKDGEHVVLQQSTILTPAAAMFKMQHPKKRSLAGRNAISAILHGRWYWYKYHSGVPV